MRRTFVPNVYIYMTYLVGSDNEIITVRRHVDACFEYRESYAYCVIRLPIQVETRIKAASFYQHLHAGYGLDVTKT